jgi:hypothetical protein
MYRTLFPELCYVYKNFVADFIMSLFAYFIKKTIVFSSLRTDSKTVEQCRYSEPHNLDESTDSKKERLPVVEKMKYSCFFPIFFSVFIIMNITNSLKRNLNP